MSTGRPIHSPKTEVSGGLGPPGMTASQGRADAQVQGPNFQETLRSQVVSQGTTVGMHVTATTAAFVRAWGSDIFSVPLPNMDCSLGHTSFSLVLFPDTSEGRTLLVKSL